MAKRQPKTRAERRSRRDELVELHRALLRDALRLDDDELLETWHVIASATAGAMLKKVAEEDMTGTSALALIAKAAREEVAALEEKKKAAEAGGKKGVPVSMGWQEDRPPDPDQYQPVDE